MSLKQRTVQLDLKGNGLFFLEDLALSQNSVNVLSFKSKPL